MLKSKVYALTISLLLGAVAHAQVPDAVSPAPARDSLSPRPVVPPVPGAPPLRNEPAQSNQPPRGEATQRGEPARGRVVEALQGLTDWVRGRGGSLSARVVDADSGALWAESAPQSALNPASNMKILTAAVALERLGAEFSFNTGLYGKQEGERVESLVLRGQG
ncbi:MAG: hypothetical protein RL033_175, partial [Pseudomonadota bacterium]